MIDTADRRFPLAPTRQHALLSLSQSRMALLAGSGLALGEMAIVVASVAIAKAGQGLEPKLLEWGLAALFALALVLLLHSAHGYRFARLREPDRLLPQLLMSAALVLAAAMAIVLPASDGRPLPLASTLSIIAVGCMALAALRIGLAMVLARLETMGGLRRRIAVLDLLPADAAIDPLALRRELEAQRRCPCAIDVMRPQAAGAEGCGDVVVETVRWAEEVVVLAVPQPAGDGRLDRIVRALEIVPVEVSLAIPLAPAAEGFATSRLHAAPMGQVARLTKRLSDIVLATLVLVFVGPLMLLVAAAVKLDSPGPVFFKQVRRGYNNRTFEALKFRSLHHAMADPLANRLVTKGDPRVTRVGAFIRRTSIDELPQLINVLTGDMSLVGPRPHPLNAKAGGRPYEEVVERFQRRYRVRPGITGWAQVNGLRGNTETEDDLLRRVELDLDYIRRWSLWLDLLILLRTPLATLKGENAC